MSNRLLRPGVDRAEMLDLLAQAYEQGCRDVHEHYQPDPDPEFGEAARDYAHAILAALPESGDLHAE